MASADLRKELECSICLNIYNNPVTLKCGHNYCRLCIEQALTTQEGSARYSCPQCREMFQERPEMQSNVTLRNIVQSFWATMGDQEATETMCTYCIHGPVPAVKSCLHCEASLCEDHLRVHNKAPEHVLCDLTTNLGSKKCSIHKKVLDYYCITDAACICASCCLIGDHKGHQIQSLHKAYEKKKKDMKAYLQEHITKRMETEEHIKTVQENWTRLQEKASNKTNIVHSMFRDIRRQLEDLEKKVLDMISRQAEQASLSVLDMIQKLEIKKDRLSTQIRHIEKLCDETDPLTLLQEANLRDPEDGGDEDRGGQCELDVAGISHTLYTGFSYLLTELTKGIYIPGPSDISLDRNTAGNCLHISDDRKTVTCLDQEQKYPETQERFQWSPQVLSKNHFSSGTHYWDVDLRGSDCWRVGVCYPSIERYGVQGESVIGDNKKSWCLKRANNQYLAVHDSKVFDLPANISVNRVRISLDYEAGQISFYELGIPIQHLHTFTATFTEPLHAAFCVWDGCVRLS